MPIYAGIDEAGYGPVLGPLCVACTVFEIPTQPEAGSLPNLWSSLTGAVCRKPGDRRRRIAIDDSKSLKGPRDGAHHPLRHLERAILAFATVLADYPTCDDALFRCLGVSLPPTGEHPWLAGQLDLPLAHEADEIRIAAASLRKVFAKTGVRPLTMHCEAVDPADFNRCLASQNKADINFDAAMRRLNAILAHTGDQSLAVVIDRHGGRVHYREPLQMYFPGSFIRIQDENDSFSQYEVELPANGAPPRRFTIRFEVESEAAHLPVALASMTAKYVRDLVMERLNAFFRSHLPELKPTAGYHQDGHRFIGDVEPVIARLGIPRDLLIRKA